MRLIRIGLEGLLFCNASPFCGTSSRSAQVSQPTGHKYENQDLNDHDTILDRRFCWLCFFCFVFQIWGIDFTDIDRGHQNGVGFMGWVGGFWDVFRGYVATFPWRGIVLFDHINQISVWGGINNCRYLHLCQVRKELGVRHKVYQ